MLRTRIPSFLMLFVTLSLPYSLQGENARDPEMLTWIPVRKLCGRLSAAQKGLDVIVPNTKLRLYAAKWRKSCCKELKLFETRTTAANGEFDFGEIQSGRYWLAVEWGGRELTLGVDVDSRHDWQGSCENKGPLIEGTSLTWIAGQAIL